MLLALGIVLLSLAPPAPAEVRARADALMGPAYQRELPGARLAVEDAPESPRPGSRQMPSAGSALGAGLYWALAAVAAALVLVWLARAWLGHAGEVAPEPPGVGAAEGSPARPDPDDAEALAAAGRHAEAVHALLLRALAMLPGDVARIASRTSREVLAAARLSPAARSALSVLVGAVERTRFGGAAPGPGDVERCRAACAVVAAEVGRA